MIVGVRGDIGWPTLNRPQVLSALSLEIIRAVSHALLAWQHNPEVHAVILRDKDGKALYASGDIRFFRRATMAGNPRLITFFTEEYRLNHLIFSYAKPYIVLIDGIIMGGGMGIPQGASLHVVTEHMKVVMPETNIGLFPDVGGGWSLTCVPGRVGEYLGVTSQMIEVADVSSVGLVDCYVTTEAQAAIIQRLRDDTWDSAKQITTCSAEVVSASDDARAIIAPYHEAINACFSQSSVQGILVNLTGSMDAEWAAQAAARMVKRPPLMMAVTLELIRRGCRTTLTDELRRELGMITYVFAGGDGIEGICTLAVDRDHALKQRHASIDAMCDNEVAAFFVSPWHRGQYPLLGSSDQNQVAAHLDFEPSTCCDR